MEQNYSHVNPGNGSKSQETLRQVADLCVQALNLPLKVTPNGFGFLLRDRRWRLRQGILSYHAGLVGMTLSC